MAHHEIGTGAAHVEARELLAPGARAAVSDRILASAVGEVDRGQRLGNTVRLQHDWCPSRGRR
jgi:hypothetical protein